MLRRILELMQQTGGVPLSLELISRQLDIPRDVTDQLVRTLVQRGRLVEVDEGCTGCNVCPLGVICAGAPHISARGYALAEQVAPSPPRENEVPLYHIRQSVPPPRLESAAD
jgi:hypothetical protein